MKDGNTIVNQKVGYLIMKITPMTEEKGNINGKDINFTPNYDNSSSFVLTSKNIGGILAVKTNNDFGKYELKEQVLESTTK